MLRVEYQQRIEKRQLPLNGHILARKTIQVSFVLSRRILRSNQGTELSASAIVLFGNGLIHCCFQTFAARLDQEQGRQLEAAAVQE